MPFSFRRRSQSGKHDHPPDLLVRLIAFRPTMLTVGKALLPSSILMPMLECATRWEEAADLMGTMRGGASAETGESANVEGLITQQTMAPVLNEIVLPVTSDDGGQGKFSNTLKVRLESSRVPWHPPSPDTYSYNCCIAACRRGGESGLARLFFVEMMSAGLRPNASTFLSMLLDPRDPPAGAQSPSRRSGDRLVSVLCSSP